MTHPFPTSERFYEYQEQISHTAISQAVCGSRRMKRIKTLPSFKALNNLFGPPVQFKMNGEWLREGGGREGGRVSVLCTDKDFVILRITLIPVVKT